MAQDAISDTEVIRLRAEVCQKIIDDCLEGKIQPAAVVELLQRAGASYDRQYCHIIAILHCNYNTVAL